jgi:gliding motility-associated-like protein
MRLLSTFLALTVFGFATNAQITVNQVTPEEAVQDILIGEGVEAFNITYTGSAVQLGYMQGAEGTGFPIPEGLILSCADAANVAEPDCFGGNDVPFGEGVSGDADLLEIANDVPGLIGQGFNVSAVNDLCILEFDFVATGDSVKFNYAFGSDEYLEWVNSSFNDIFAFFLSGPGITGPYDSPPDFPDGAINIAQLPDSDPPLPITVSSVNDQLNSEFYIDNFNNEGICQDGYTVTLEASAEVQCGETYHIKLAIADGTDTALESIVVLEAGSFTTSAAISASVPDAPPSLPPLTMLEGCVDGVFTVFRPNANEQDTLFLEIDGTATNLDDYTGLPDFVVFPDGELTLDIPVTTLPDDLVEGLEFITLTYDYTNACGEQDTIVAQLNIQDYIPPTLNLPEDVFLCNGESTTLNATPNDGFAPFSYNWSSGGSAPTESVSPADGDSIFVTVNDFCGSEVGDSLAIIIPDPFVPADSTELCLGGSTPILATGGALPYTVEVVEYDNDGNEVTIDPEDPPFVEEEGSFIYTSQYVGNFEIFITDACNETVSVVVEVGTCVTEFPNIFTPNGDGDNELFYIFGLEGFPGSRLVVYNRWGTVVYEDDNYSNNWNAEGVSDGVYYYVLTRSDDEQFSGSVTIKRN